MDWKNKYTTLKRFENVVAYVWNALWLLKPWKTEINVNYRYVVQDSARTAQ